MNREITVITPTGCIGNRGIHKETFQKVIQQETPDVVAVDAGSIDCGPWYLGSGLPHSPAQTIRWDLELLLGECVSKKIPLIIGSAGGSGAAPHVRYTINVVQDIAERLGLNFRLAVILSDIDKNYLKKRIQVEQIPGIDELGVLAVEDVEGATGIVAMMGIEPIIKALDAGADVVIAGRATDNGTIAAYPVWCGADKGLALHMGDIMECGESALVETEDILRSLGPNRIPIIGEIGSNYFLIKAGHPHLSCTPQSAAAHALYERSEIYQSIQPGGILEKSNSKYEAVDAKTTRVTGSKFIVKTPYTVCLEGVRRVGFRSVTIMGIRSPRMIEQIDDILAEAREIETRLFGSEGSVCIYFHLFGKNAVLKDMEFLQHPSQELGLVADIVADTQELAHQVAEDLWLRLSFWRYEGRQTTAGNCAILFSPNVIDAGEAFEFSIYHALPLNDPCEVFPMQIIQVG